MGEYKNPPSKITWMCSIQKKLLEDASRGSRNNRLQEDVKQDQRSSKKTVEYLESNNSALQEAITETKEEDGGIEDRNRTLKAPIELSIGRSSAEMIEDWAHRRGAIIRQRGSYP